MKNNLRISLGAVALSLFLGGCHAPAGDDGYSVNMRTTTEAAPDAGLPGMTTGGTAVETADEQDFTPALTSPTGTFSVDVNTASYAFARSAIADGKLPPAGSVRIEEFVNYFDYRYPAPVADSPLGVTVEGSGCPWNESHRIIRIGVNAREVPATNRPGCNLVLLVDTSSSMNGENRLGLLKRSFLALLEQLDERDSLAIVTYAGSSETAASPTFCDAAGKQKLARALRNLFPNPEARGAAGIKAAYRLAKQNFRPEGVNRVVIATDGDFHVGVADDAELVELARKESEEEVFLTVLGFGRANLNAALMNQLSLLANGSHYAVDTPKEAGRILGLKLAGTLAPVARDVKIQVDFNPARVESYRLLGYDMRRVTDQDFSGDPRDAGEMGSGQSVTALYEIIPAGADNAVGVAAASRYLATSPLGKIDDWLSVKVRWLPVNGETSLPIERPVGDSVFAAAGATSDDQTFALAVAEFALTLRESKHKGAAGFDNALKLLEKPGTLAGDGDRVELKELVKRAAAIEAEKKPGA